MRKQKAKRKKETNKTPNKPTKQQKTGIEGLV